MRARDVALYFLQTEPDLFSDNIIKMNGHDMYEGNLRLNKYLHIAQNVHLAMTGENLFDDSLHAYDNGGVVPDVQKNYSLLKKARLQSNLTDSGTKEFLDKIANTLRNADVYELVDISHQDREWGIRNNTDNQKMDSLSRASEYREQYKDIIKMMELGIC